MRFSKVFFPVALAASTIAADPYSTLKAFKEQSKEVVFLVHSVTSATVNTDLAEIAAEFSELAQIGVEAAKEIETCSQFNLFVQIANAALDEILKRPASLGAFDQLIGAASHKWEDFLTSAGFALIDVSPTCPNEAPKLKSELAESAQYLRRAERASANQI